MSNKFIIRDPETNDFLTNSVPIRWDYCGLTYFQIIESGERHGHTFNSVELERFEPSAVFDSESDAKKVIDTVQNKSDGKLQGLVVEKIQIYKPVFYVISSTEEIE